MAVSIDNEGQREGRGLSCPEAESTHELVLIQAQRFNLTLSQHRSQGRLTDPVHVQQS